MNRCSQLSTLQGEPRRGVRSLRERSNDCSESIVRAHGMSVDVPVDLQEGQTPPTLIAEVCIKHSPGEDHETQDNHPAIDLSDDGDQIAVLSLHAGDTSNGPEQQQQGRKVMQADC